MTNNTEQELYDAVLKELDIYGGLERGKRQTNGETASNVLAIFSTHLNQTLTKIGEPMLGDFDIKPESYEDVLKAIRWYKDRIDHLLTKYGGKS